MEAFKWLNSIIFSFEYEVSIFPSVLVKNKIFKLMYLSKNWIKFNVQARKGDLDISSKNLLKQFFIQWIHCTHGAFSKKLCSCYESFKRKILQEGFFDQNSSFHLQDCVLNSIQYLESCPIFNGFFYRNSKQNRSLKIYTKMYYTSKNIIKC